MSNIKSGFRKDWGQSVIEELADSLSSDVPWMVSPVDEELFEGVAEEGSHSCSPWRVAVVDLLSIVAAASWKKGVSMSTV